MRQLIQHRLKTNIIGKTGSVQPAGNVVKKFIGGGGGPTPPAPLATAVPLDFTSTNTITGTGADFTVDWGDGTPVPYTDGAAASSIASGNIVVVGPLTHIRFNSNTFSDVNIVDGTTLTSMENICRQINNLVTFSATNTQNVTDFSFSWLTCTGLTSFPLIDTSAATTFFYAWNGCSGLTSFPLIDTTSASIISNTWQGCSGLTSFPLIDTSSGTNFNDAWNGCTNLVCLSSVNTLLQTTANNMFLNTPALVNPTSIEQTAIEIGANYVNGNACP